MKGWFLNFKDKKVKDENRKKNYEPDLQFNPIYNNYNCREKLDSFNIILNKNLNFFNL